MSYFDVHVEPWVRPYCMKILIKAFLQHCIMVKVASKQQLVKNDLDTALHEPT